MNPKGDRCYGSKKKDYLSISLNAALLYEINVGNDYRYFHRMTLKNKIF